MMKINYNYQIRYKEVKDFYFEPYNQLVDYTTYEKPIKNQINKVVKTLLENSQTRQAVIIVNSGIDKHNSCLLNIQFQMVNEVLILIATFRSQCEVYGKKSDTLLLRYIATIFLDKLKKKNPLYNALLRSPFVKIYVNVGNYHKNKLEDEIK